MTPMMERAPWSLVGALLLAQALACGSTPEATVPHPGPDGGPGPVGADANAGSAGAGADATTTSDLSATETFDSGPTVADLAAEAIRDGSGGETPGPMLPAGVPPGYKLLLDQSFASPDSLAQILAGNPPDWTHADQDGGFLQYGGVGYVPPNPPIPESFTSFALVRAMKFGSFVLDVELMQRNPNPAPQRDLCIVFGIKSETEYYYAHIAEAHTDRWHDIHIIDDAPRRPITLTNNGGIRWLTNQWQKFRVVRDVATGEIAVYMDGDLTAPILTAKDTTFTEGYVGFATHQDSGRVRNLKVWGTSATVQPAPANFFRSR
jgi:hypothetical protein